MDSVFDCNFEIYDDLVQRRSNLINRLKELRNQRAMLEIVINEATAHISSLCVEIERMKGGVE